MGIASTKLRDRKKDEMRNLAQDASGEPDKPDSPEISPLVWRLASLTILAISAFVRLYELGLKPMHHDEGVNGFFLTNLYRNGIYHYDPTNYHGPTLYYFALAITKFNAFLFGGPDGLSTVAVRLVPVIFGVATVWLVLCLRRHIGTIGALTAAALVALSPGHVFISRYFIHEAHFVFFTLGIIVAALNYYDRKRPTLMAMGALALTLSVILIPSIYRFFLWRFPSAATLVQIVLSGLLGAGLTLAAVYVLYSEDEGRPVYLLLAFVSAAFLFATKETAIISVGVLLIAFIFATVYLRFTKAAWLTLPYIVLQSAIIYLRFRTIETTLISAAITIGICLVAAIFVIIYLRIINERTRHAFPGKRKKRKKAPARGVREEWSRYALFIASLTLGGAIGAIILGLFFDFSKMALLFFELPIKMMLILAGVLFLIAVVSVAIDLRHKKGLLQSLLLTLAASALFIFVNIVFYSSFYTYRDGVGGALESVQVWAQTGTKEHAHDVFTYLVWLWKEEAPLLFLGMAGAITALVRRQNRFAVFAGAWAFGILAAYSLIPYKTPWLMLSFIVPLAIIGGYSLNELYNYEKNFSLRIAAIGILVVVLTVSGTQSVMLNFYHYDDDSYPYVYAHTHRDFLKMVDKIEELAQRAEAETGQKTGITITSPEYWPLPWYLRNYEHAGFFGHMATTDQPIVVGSIEQIPELNSMLGDGYQLIDSYPLRPGVTLVLYAKTELIRP